MVLRVNKLIWHTILVGVLLLLPRYATSQVFDWAWGAGEWTDDRARNVATDANGAVYITGDLNGGTTIGDTTLLHGGAYVAKVSADGRLIWAKSFGAFDTFGTDIKVDTEGNVFLLGVYSHGFTLADYSLSGSSLPKIFLMKADAAGTVLWVKSFAPIQGNGEIYGQSIAIDYQDNVYIGGHFSATLPVGDSVHQVRGREIFDRDMLLIKLDGDGEVQWARTPGSISEEYIYDVAVDAQGVYFVGHLSGRDVEFEDTTFRSPLSGMGFIGKYSLAGVYQWAEVFHSPHYSKAFSVAVDDVGDVYASGIWMVSGYYDRVDRFIAKLTPEGQKLFTRFIESDFIYAENSGIATHGTDVYFTSGLASPYQIGRFRSDSSHIERAAIIKYNEIGYPQWVKLAEGPGSDHGTAVVTNQSKLFVAGNYSSEQLAFDDLSIVNNSGNRNTDFFLASVQDTTPTLCPDAASFRVAYDTSFCSGDSVRLRIDNPYAVYTQWYRNGKKLAYDNQQSIYVAEAGTYTVEINSHTACSAFPAEISVSAQSERDERTNVVIFTKPEITIQAPLQVCTNETVTFSVNNDYSNYRYRWVIPTASATEGASTSTPAATWTTASGAAQVIVMVEDTTTACVTYDTLTVIVLAAPVATLQNVDGRLVASKGASYRWYFDGDELVELVGKEAIIPQHLGYYQVEISNGAGCRSRSDSVLVDTVVGIEDLVDKLAVFPNPFVSYLLIDSEQPAQKVILINAAGKIVKEEYGISRLDVGDVRSGVYLLLIRISGQWRTYKVLK